ncbi:FAD-binding oxidoreductase [Puniceibacterium sp. IMCC21224]|uniref:NAD(P)/FAD-dependent oxidoreductase n=1 Tax=Puniceibacterium sp. IMCC21224 TaxID=1618204 RepID=UPI00064DA90C|nr:FAD-binding oxidoreductase [Puniceibacterium sp. IMCC21224]KMK68781.1 glycine/D-amino acid oxidase, deaminating [Puniceibacterium sp. IMCC21224]
MARIDVTVRGAGIFGLSVAWACVQRGARVQVIDPFGPGAGSSGGIVGALAPHVPEQWNPKKAFQLDSLLMSQAFWSEVEATGGVTAGYARLGRLQPVADAAGLDLAKSRARGAATLWRGAAEWRVVTSADVGPWAPQSPSGWHIHDTLSARVHPRRACAALVAALEVRGVSVVADAADEGQVLWATGWRGLETLSEGRARVVGAGVKGQAVLLRHDAGAVPQLFVDGLHIIPHDDGTVAIGSTSERDFDDPTSVDAACDLLHERACAALSVLHGAEVIQRWAGVRPRARSRAPMLGAWPDRAGHFIANGGFKIGFGMAPKVAEVMADLMLDGRDTVPMGFEVAASF